MDAPEIEKLKALALAAIDKGTDGALQEFQGEALPEAVLALIAEVERLRADAERYRWLTEAPGYIRPHLNGQAVYVNWSGTKQALDAAIDAAITHTKARDA